MNKYAQLLVALLIALLALAGCRENRPAIASISLDYPHGETRLLVRRDGETLLFYGPRPQHQIIRQGIFDVDALYEQLRDRLHDNVPREEWPDPQSVAGTVQISYTDRTEQVYLIFDAEAFAERIFDEARRNVVGESL